MCVTHITYKITFLKYLIKNSWGAGFFDAPKDYILPFDRLNVDMGCSSWVRISMYGYGYIYIFIRLYFRDLYTYNREEKMIKSRTLS